MKRSKFALRPVLSLLGPAFVAAIAYVDPGNFATNISAGSHYGYLLLWVLIVANLMASLIQYLSAKLGLVTGQSLPEVVRDNLPRTARLAYWAQAELAAVATDIAEVLGGAIALQLLFNLPLLAGGLITGAVSMGLLFVHSRRGQKVFERVTLGLLLIIPLGFIAGLVLRPPQSTGLVHGLVPGFQGQGSIVLAAGVLGATVMPHVIYLHSALARDRHGRIKAGSVKSFLAATRIDVGVAMVIAGGINIAMLLFAASALRGVPGTDTLVGAYHAIQTHVSTVVATLFAVGLLASGLASTTVGCYAGSVIMGGLLQRRLSLFVRRLVTLVPALLLITLGANPTKALVLSQVVLSFAIPFAIVPLIWATASAKLMGAHANAHGTNVVAWLVTSTIVALNVFLIVSTLQS